MKIRKLGNREISTAVAMMVRQWPQVLKQDAQIYGVPRGGIPIAYMALACLGPHCNVVDSPDDATIFVDDIIDSGKTRDHYAQEYPNVPFTAPFAKSDEWLSFPWERHEGLDEGPEQNFVRLLQYIGEDPQREGLLETPKRVVKAWRQWTSGYGVQPAQVLKTFDDGAEGYNEMVLVKDIPFYSHCEHHLAPFFGTASIGYIPNGKIVGLSKLSRLLDVFARRLQVQERLTCQIANALVEHLDPKGVGVRIKARHLCMESRGICQQGHHTVTNALRGVLLSDAAARAEFMGLL